MIICVALSVPLDECCGKLTVPEYEDVFGSHSSTCPFRVLLESWQVSHAALKLTVCSTHGASCQPYADISGNAGIHGLVNVSMLQLMTATSTLSMRECAGRARTHQLAAL